MEIFLCARQAAGRTPNKDIKMKNRTIGAVALSVATVFTFMGLCLGTANAAPIQLPDTLNIITGQLDSEDAIKSYSFTAVRGQRVMIHPLDNPTGDSPWTIEYKLGDDWTVVRSNESVVTADLEPGQKVELRVSRNTQHPITASNEFQLEFGSAPFVERQQLSGDADHLKFNEATTKAFKTLTWGGKVNDSKGHPLKGATVVLEVNKTGDTSQPNTLYTFVTNTAGGFATRSELGKCSGNLVSAPFVITDGTAQHRAQASYNKGYWLIYPRGNKNSGIGGRASEEVSLAHICGIKKAN